MPRNKCKTDQLIIEEKMPDFSHFMVGMQEKKFPTHENKKMSKKQGVQSDEWDCSLRTGSVV